MKPTLFHLLALCAAVAAPALAQTAPEPPPIRASSYVLMEAETGQILAAREIDKRVEPASITKVMTVYVTLDEIRKERTSLDDTVLISERAWRQGLDSSQSRMFIEVGKRVRVEDLLRGVIIQSGNDASVALAEHIAGSEQAFASLMSQYAQQLGMKNSSFTNSSGMPDEGHHTTAHDIALMARALIREFPEGYGMYSEREFTFNNIRQFNRNRLLWRDGTVDGVKTGHTISAGFCLVSSANRDGRRLISVIMGSDSEERRAQDSLALLNYGFRFFEAVELHAAGDPIHVTRAYRGAIAELPVGMAESLTVSIPRGARARLDTQVQVDTPVLAPVAAGQALGTVSVMLDGKTLRSEPLLALTDVPEGSLWQRLVDSVRLQFLD